jgi:hypothetical protein
VTELDGLTLAVGAPRGALKGAIAAAEIDTDLDENTAEVVTRHA